MSWEQQLREIVFSGGALAAMGCSSNSVYAASTDASSDAVDYDVVSPFCCNANPDPCCRVLYCGEVTDGNPSCSFPQEAGPSNAAADGDAHD